MYFLCPTLDNYTVIMKIQCLLHANVKKYLINGRCGKFCSEYENTNNYNKI